MQIAAKPLTLTLGRWRHKSNHNRLASVHRSFPSYRAAAAPRNSNTCTSCSHHNATMTIGRDDADPCAMPKRRFGQTAYSSTMNNRLYLLIIIHRVTRVAR